MVQDKEWFFDTELLLLAERNGLRVHEVPVTWIDDPDSRVKVIATARDDLKGVARMATAFMRGRGAVDLGPAHAQPLADDFGRQLVVFAKIGVVSTLVSLVLFLLLRGSVGRGVGEPHRSRSDGGRQHMGQPPLHLRLPRQPSARSPLHGWRGDLAGRSGLTSLALAKVTGELAQVLVLLRRGRSPPSPASVCCATGCSGRGPEPQWHHVRRTPPRVLVVDDEENISFLVESALQLDGIETAKAGRRPSRRWRR